MERIVVVVTSSPAEEAEALAIRKAVFIDEQKVSSEAEFDGLDASSDHLLALDDGHPVGTLRLRTIGDRCFKIERVAVLEHARSRGVGAMLMDKALLHLRELGCIEARLHAQTHALGFYERHGFSAYGGVFDEDGIAHKAMIKGWHGAEQPADRGIVALSKDKDG